MTAMNDGESRRKEVEISTVETMRELLAVTSIDPALSEESRTTFALAAALFRVRAVELQGADTLAPREVVLLELEAFLKAREV